MSFRVPNEKLYQKIVFPVYFVININNKANNHYPADIRPDICQYILGAQLSLGDLNLTHNPHASNANRQFNSPDAVENNFPTLICISLNFLYVCGYIAIPSLIRVR